MNFVEIAGYLGSDAEERFTPNGKRVISFRVGAKVRQGGKDETIWWRINIWSDRFDKMLPYLKKGTAVIIFGEMSKPETYVDKEGRTQVTLTLTAEIIKFSPFGKAEKGEGAQTTAASTFSRGGGAHSTNDPFAKEEVGAGFAYGGGSNDDYTGDDLPF